MFSRITSQIHRSSSTPCTITSHLLPLTSTSFSSLSHPSICRTFATATAITSSTPTPTPTPSPIPTQSSYLASVEKRFLGRLAVARTRVEKGLARSLPTKIVTKTSAPIHPDILLSSDAFLAKRGESRTYMIWKFLKTYAPLTRIQLWMVHGPGGINPILRSKKQLAHITTNLKRMKLVYTRPPPRTDPLSSGPSSTRASHEVRGQEWYHCYYHVRKFDGTDPMELLFKQQRKALGLRPWTPEKKRLKTASQIRFMERQHAAFEARHGYPYPAHPIRHKPIKPDYTRKTPKIVRYDEIKKAKIALQANIDAETAKSRKELETI